jgi:hypothetical protein
MLRISLLLLCSFSLSMAHAQQTDTLTLFYEPDQYRLTAAAKDQLEAFLKGGWDRLAISSFTDETDGDEYNLALSKRRAEAVYRYLLGRQIKADYMALQYFGETAPLADNGTEEGRAVNRQTRIVGYRYPRIQPKPVVNPMQPVTTTLDNGFIITYRPGTLPEEWLWYLESGRSPFQLITNTQQMRQTALYTNTTRGEILSSVLVFCGNALQNCRLDSPILLKIPIPRQVRCPVENIKFFNTVAEQGKLLWQEQSKQLYPEVIDGRQYLRVWMDDFCQCINFDIKIDPQCFATDSTQLLVHTKVRNLTTELVGLNSVYLPRKSSDSTHRILFIKEEPEKALMSFSVYHGRRYLRSFRNRPLTLLPYNEALKSYEVKLDSVRFYLPRQKNHELYLRVNGDRYRVGPEGNRYRFVYMKRNDETLTVDLHLQGKKDRMWVYKNIPLASLPYDADKGEYVVDKAFQKELELRKAVTRK